MSPLEIRLHVVRLSARFTFQTLLCMRPCIGPVVVISRLVPVISSAMFVLSARAVVLILAF